MPKLYWVAALVLGLTAISPSWSQESAIDEQAQAQRQAEGGQDEAPPLGIPVRILEEPEQSESNKRREEEAGQREVEDLVAQQSMADSTKEIVLWTRLQFLLALTGTLALVYSLYLNRVATSAAVDAVRMERAWMLIANISSGQVINTTIIDERGTTHIKNGLAFVAKVTNSGRTPALAVRMAMAHRVQEEDEPIPDLHRTIHDSAPASVIAPNDSVAPRTFLDDDEATALRSGSKVAIIHYLIEYRDVFQPASGATPRINEGYIVARHGGGTIVQNGVEREMIDFLPLGKSQRVT